MGCWRTGGNARGKARNPAQVPMGTWLGRCGQIVAVGEKVTGFSKGDLVYGHVWGTNPKAGFYAEYTALNAEQAWPIPSTITAEQAGALLIDGGTALRGLDDTLNLKKGEKLMVFGASGGLGHLAVQLGKRLGARVFAIASGEDGVALARRLGAEAAVDGHGGEHRRSGPRVRPGWFRCGPDNGSRAG